MRARVVFAILLVLFGVFPHGRGVADEAIGGESVAGFFNGDNLVGWTATDMSYWSVRDGAIVGHSDAKVPTNQFLWSSVLVRDFKLTVDVRLTPNQRNAGIQFRSTRKGAVAVGYQADVGRGVWGRLYHEHDRGKLDWRDRGEKAVKPGDWNRYEILAVGDRIWTAINGTLAVSVRDPKGEREGLIALQIHSGPGQTVEYRNPTLVNDPAVELAGLGEAALNAELLTIGSDSSDRVRTRPPQTAEVQPTAETELSWSERIAVADPGSQNEAWAQPDFDDGAWQTMKLPGHFENAGLPDYDGVVWFRTRVELPAGVDGAGSLELGPVDDMDVTWVNGRRVGGYETPGDHFTPRNYPVPKGVLKPGSNTIAVRVMDHGWPGGIAGTPEQMRLRVGGTAYRLDVPWHYRAGADLATLNAVTAAGDVEKVEDPRRTEAFKGGFSLADNDVVVFMGGTNMLKEQDHGYLETLLTRAAGSKRVYFRNMAWQADTVFRRQRPRNFGSQLGHLDRVNASVVMMAFGQVESMAGMDTLDEFLRSYRELLAEVAGSTRKIVLVTPMPFQKADNPHLPDLTRHNDAVAAYAEAIRGLAAEMRYPVVDLSRVQLWPGAMTDGMHLNAEGQQQFAVATVSALLGTASARGAAVDVRGAFQDEKLEKKRQAIIAKNVLWFRHWRPTNWGFLYGNRQTQPSSRDHVDRSKRWFPKEVNAILLELEKAEDGIEAMKP